MIYSLKSAIFQFINLLEFLIFVDALLSWVIRDRYNNPIVRVIDTIINPIKEPFYRLQFKLLPNTPVDFSPMLAIFFLEILKTLLFF